MLEFRYDESAFIKLSLSFVFWLILHNYVNSGQPLNYVTYI